MTGTVWSIVRASLIIRADPARTADGLAETSLEIICADWGP